MKTELTYDERKVLEAMRSLDGPRGRWIGANKVRQVVGRGVGFDEFKRLADLDLVTWTWKGADCSLHVKFTDKGRAAL